ncbi:lipoate--protein ligase family protein [Oscillatoria sp. FACHB-1407]|uniref:lipoate--protein ligase family protein n=1 Tax=Oscillatoria sp. FACHB-1407 TaxID=2692847 RepID=UPI001688C726|nr:biotin/lipoate A/B protein ligase family protein [Oscillatoria sp. FACHB-1407]MBD2465058.1 lipoate--protein ligase family protein [Oscillatoria sp. FACHB-1407]
MGLDAWLFEQHCTGLHPPTLRFYTWSPVAISLGYHQQRYPNTWHDLTWQGALVDVVRRPTGGRAVLHQGDLTYAVIASDLPTNRLAAYQQICEFLIEGWRSLGVSLHFGQAGRGYIHNPNCFGTATGADLVLPDGTKLIGSAQLRRGAIALQHGSMRLATDSTFYQQVFGAGLEAGVPTPDALPLDFRRGDHWQRVIDALTASAERCFGIQLVPQPLSDQEWRTVSAISEAYKVSG